MRKIIAGLAGLAVAAGLALSSAPAAQGYLHVANAESFCINHTKSAAQFWYATPGAGGQYWWSVSQGGTDPNYYERHSDSLVTVTCNHVGAFYNVAPAYPNGQYDATARITVTGSDSYMQDANAWNWCYRGPFTGSWGGTSNGGACLT